MIFKSSGSREEVNSSLLKYKTSQDNEFWSKNIHCLQIFDTGFYPKTMLQKGFGFHWLET
jgi:hypothetical protein